MELNEMKELYDIKEVVQILGVSRSTVYHLIRDNCLKKINVSERRVKITGESLYKHIKKHQKAEVSEGKKNE